MSGARRRLWLIPVALLVTAALTGVATWQAADGIESDLASRSQAALAGAGLTGGQVTFDGRDATLRGFPDDKAQQAADVVRGVDGVRLTTVEAGSIPAAPPPSTTTPPPSPPSTPSAPPTTTSAPPPVNKAGLQKAIDSMLAEQPISFEPDSDKLTPDGEKAAQRIAELISAVPFTPRIQVDGYVGRGPGGKQAALKLSQNRAKAAAKLLVHYGVPTARVTSKGFGDTRSGTGGEDRRVEITVR
ncbi:OmpA family protein [Amycolatopsis sp.]|jgi:outer membrane protein OmpA-like peptidoglycan-associated protein|uniref:OmpA family protein n=1 Tax=Amycolatopsis sp. TaxID=37632 RepID=UPI002DFF779F|nr:OmpA family protein [Amycolatopsis sp.]